MAEFHIDDTVDITDVVCPVTFVKAKVALEELDDGQILSIHMNDGEPVQNVPSKPGDIPERSAGGRWSGSGGFLLGQLRSL